MLGISSRLALASVYLSPRVIAAFKSVGSHTVSSLALFEESIEPLLHDHQSEYRTENSTQSREFIEALEAYWCLSSHPEMTTPSMALGTLVGNTLCIEPGRTAGSDSLASEWLIQLK